jgi:uncharacterized protein YjbJ (UPF0337 family)
MNWDQAKGKWKQLKGSAKTQWGKLTDDDLEVIAGQQDVLVGKIQERYGITKEAALKQVDDWDPTGLDESDSQRKHEREQERKAS